MHRSHGIGYGEYTRSHAVRLEVEKKREEQYKKSKEIVLDLMMTG